MRSLRTLANFVLPSFLMVVSNDDAAGVLFRIPETSEFALVFQERKQTRDDSRN